MTDEPQPATHVPPAEGYGLFSGSIDQVAPRGQSAKKKAPAKFAGAKEQ